MPDTALMPEQSLQASLTQRGLRLRSRRRHAPRARSLRARSTTGRRLPAAGTISRSTSTWPTAGAIGAGGTPCMSPRRTAPSRARPPSRTIKALDYNPLNGGVARWFAPVTPAVGGGPSMRTILDVLPRAVWPAGARGCAMEDRSASVPDRSAAGRRRTADAGRHASRRRGLRPRAARESVATSPAARRRFTRADGRELGRFTLTQPLDAALVDDSRVSHGVTPVQALDASAPAYRDVLVVTFKSSQP